MAVAEDGRLFGWGSNEHGQLATSNHIKSYDTPKWVLFWLFLIFGYFTEEFNT